MLRQIHILIKTQGCALEAFVQGRAVIVCLAISGISVKRFIEQRIISIGPYFGLHLKKVHT